MIVENIQYSEEDGFIKTWKGSWSFGLVFYGIQLYSIFVLEVQTHEYKLS